MKKDGITNSSIEQIKKDHETESAFQQDNNQKQKKKNK
ncbi:biofilm-forming protein [Bacillus sp. PS06]|nr:biofilm-forming protein [Bacillus sp. PS06]MBD8071500.1 biofilm-forming protein [Bacillus sp. PS06]